jgi:hypothetical protein
MGRVKLSALLAGAGLLLCAGSATSAFANEYAWGGKLDLTRGVANVEGAGGGGIASWALITGNETPNGVGGEAYGTYIGLTDYSVREFGGGLGFYDLGEITVSRQTFDTGATGAKLGLGKGFAFDQTVVGAKLRVAGDAVYGQNSWLPQIAVGVQYKMNDRAAIIHAVGGKDDSGVDYYVAATKILLNQSLVLDATLRETRANQFGFLGFGGDKNSNYSTQFEGSAGYLVNRRLLVGAEYRTKPDNLGFAREDAAYDIFAAFAITHNLSATAAYVDLGDIATFRHQRGVFISLQAGF